jgi:ribonuclease HI
LKNRMKRAASEDLRGKSTRTKPSFVGGSSGAGTKKSCIVYFDGGCRGNQNAISGDAGCGCVIKENGKTVYEVSMYLGTGLTNNIAEYRALQAGLEKCMELKMTDVVFMGDSLLVVNQMNGLWQVKAANIKPLYALCKSLAENFASVEFLHVRRERNTEADALANEAMNTKTDRKGRPRGLAPISL